MLALVLLFLPSLLRRRRAGASLPRSPYGLGQAVASSFLLVAYRICLSHSPAAAAQVGQSLEQMACHPPKTFFLWFSCSFPRPINRAPSDLISARAWRRRRWSLSPTCNSKRRGSFYLDLPSRARRYPPFPLSAFLPCNTHGAPYNK
ncbi:hypothetical protein GGS23DRAFT_566706 [Durotheca rogersii]|uniref:uncharacterized protein n=1 Tax=Durotheca rogersii TaxID=419775 RepID=UPI00221E907E|nr:uncharacterized protein GGS23DRAFT_566706 [Durotheca rogersii]KAI5863389.1 hypothetical protein GGS23DRAFT_566706 [Durotheca rogersii]